ncbi:hypothetical protein Leryth_004133 [Lithospermum erythrorhizon]|nr:hypothetical protein Leryth_004133 [Lithospermum erythrorhizon]
MNIIKLIIILAHILAILGFFLLILRRLRRRGGEDYPSQEEYFTFDAKVEGRENDFGCVVCLDEINCGQRYRKLTKCNHCFHADCIDSWFESHQTCPLCRREIPQKLRDQNVHSSVFFYIVSYFESLLLKVHSPLNQELTLALSGNMRFIY